MNKQTIIIVSVLFLLLTGMVMYVLSAAPSTDMTTRSDTTASPSPTMSPSSTQTNDTPVAPGTYTDYSESKVASTAGTKLLFFHAPWCPQCRALDQDIRASSLPTNTTIFKVDYDSNQALRQKYGVTLQTTIVSIDDGGNLLKKYVAYDKPTFANVKENVLE